MRVMVIIKADKVSEGGAPPDEKLLTDMTKFNEELVNAGVMLAGEGLHPSSRGKRVTFSRGKTTVIDGPFAETKELIAGFWIWKVKSLDEAVAWVNRMPPLPPDHEDCHIELRPVYELDDFGSELTPEARAMEESQRARIEQQQHKS